MLPLVWLVVLGAPVAMLALGVALLTARGAAAVGLQASEVAYR